MYAMDVGIILCSSLIKGIGIGALSMRIHLGTLNVTNLLVWKLY
jgi:hypothetical protein